MLRSFYYSVRLDVDTETEEEGAEIAEKRLNNGDFDDLDFVEALTFDENGNVEEDD